MGVWTTPPTNAQVAYARMLSHKVGANPLTAAMMQDRVLLSSYIDSHKHLMSGR